ncbi:MAG: hypothetical protein ACUVRD_08675 [Bacteroidia bacterium]
MYRLLVLGILVAQEVVQDYYFPFQLSQEFSFSYVDLDGGMVLVRQRDPRVSRYFDLVRYDAEGKILWEKQILDRRDYARNPGRVEVVDTMIYVFSYGELGNTLWVEGYNLQGQAAFPAQQITTWKRGAFSEYKFYRSRNRKVVAVLFRLSDTRALRWGYVVMRGGVPQVGEWETSLPPERTYLEDAAVGNQGDIFLLFAINPTMIVLGRGDFKLQLVKILPEKNSAVEISLPTERKKVIQELRLFVDKEENVRFAGSYAKTIDGQTKGLVFIDLPAGALSPKEPVYMEFPEEIRKKYFSIWKIHQRFLMHSIIPRADGGVLVAGEMFYLTRDQEVVPMDFFGRPWLWISEKYTYHYRDALLFNLSPTGQIEWHCGIPKKQKGKDLTQLSYVLFAGKGGIYLFYKAREKRQRMGLYTVHLDFQGNLSNRKRFIPALRRRDVFLTDNCQQISNQEGFLVWWQKKGKILHAARISF